jgi:hypothetical protein
VRACGERAAALGRRLLVCSSRPDMEPPTASTAAWLRRTPERDWSPRPDVPLVTFALALDPA